MVIRIYEETSGADHPASSLPLDDDLYDCDIGVDSERLEWNLIDMISCA